MEFKIYKLSELVKRKKVSANIESDKTYKRVTVKLYHKGVFLRDEEIGSNIKSSMFYVSEGDFILSGIDARNGAFGIVPKDLEGAVITNDFWCLEPKDNLLDKEFFLFLTSTSFFDYICKVCSDGTTQRIRLQKDKFFDFEISIPSLENQKLLVEKLKTVNESGNSISTEITHQLDLIKNLRQAFLREAMQGLLVSNETSDNKTGADLLAEIQADISTSLNDQKSVAERSRSHSKIKKKKPFAPVTEEEIPFAIPENWTWCRVDDVSTKIGSGSTPKGSNYSEEGYPFFRSQNIKNEGLVFDDIKFISDEVQKQMIGTQVLANDLLLNITGGSLGRCALVPNDFEEGNVSQHVCIIRGVKVLPKFYHFLVLSPYFQTLIFSSTTGAGREGLPKYNLELFTIPLPPLEIQERIVAKLDELMSYCDALEEQVKQSQQTNELLLQQVLREALGA